MSVRKDDKTGRWFFRTRVRYPDGTKKQIYGTPGVSGPFHDLSNTKIGAMEAERRAISAVVTGKPHAVAAAPKTEVHEQKKTIREHSVSFLENYKPESKPSTKRDRSYSLDSHLLPALGNIVPEELKQTDVDTFVRAELERGIARKTINCRLGTLSSLVKYATGERSKLRFNIGGMAAEIHAVDPADVERLLAACTDDRYRAVILLASEAGLRAGEIRGLQWTDVRDGQVTIRRALDKETGRVIAPKHDKIRTVPLSKRIVEILAKLPRRGIWIVSTQDGGPLNYYTCSRTMNALYDRAGVAHPPKPIHCLRHTFGTVMARKVPLGVLQKLMGHADVQTTMRYVDVSEDDKRDAIATVFGRAVAVQSPK